MVSYLVENDIEKLLAQATGRLDHRSVALNVACEYERIPRWLPDAVDPSRVFGLEINRDLVAQDPNIKYCDVDRDRFPFPDDGFDLIVSLFGVEHFQTDNVFHEAHRTLISGGRFVFLVPNVLYPAFAINSLMGRRFAAFFYRRVMRSPYKPHETFYRFNRLGTIRSVAKRAGFSKTDITFFGPANILLYVHRFPFLKRVVTVVERVLTNRVLFRFKPYILAVFEK
ncbi:hypothetical protein A3E39_03265 [Candidatus Uhrbacteria bacterium RIFCSPHIGHO2_12_FULL_60_25]|uniref:Methyltransferase type 11 domain-containing protein n=1 Tax=Candidatus Uhrbacteria bacterium RIFCSPHIGHO2_12_FULL_60_25 TaxID=1802399 RepID=A0A1F7UNF6_9BACT|nr:MAG: hypothetical protein A3D73_00765 [Candidatus Uhrbacteria bacterium RIFCSPHIGHO2_02_FULL_60_44]OGL79802.1 MAG: hypothetical protein A3E39_03265 [Candidatus Uhrbacteria bacterium RIFCSPHIGHO2_12_FULL_60_25]